MQILSIIGTYAASLLLITLSTLPYIFLAKFSSNNQPVNYPRSWIISPILLILLLVTNFIYGYIRLSQAELNKSEDNFQILVADAAISKHHAFDSKKMIDNIIRIINAVKEPYPRNNTDQLKKSLIIIPESAIPNVASKTLIQNSLINHLRDQLTTDGAILFGSNRTNTAWDNSDYLPQVDTKIWNSALLISPQNELISQYHKINLVPFGEYVPYSNYLQFIKPLTNIVNLNAGLNNLNMEVAGRKFSPLICFDAIFSGKVINKDLENPDFLVNITNDFWFQLNFLNRNFSTQPYQHFYNVRFRAIEEGIALIRSSNMGITAVVDPYGRIIQEKPIGQPGSLIFNLPSPLPNLVTSDDITHKILENINHTNHKYKTKFAKYGNQIPTILFFILTLILITKIIWRQSRAAKL